MNTNQMELSFAQQHQTSCRTGTSRRRNPGARWWFDQMHAAVDRAFDWSRTAQPRPEQTFISFGPRARHVRPA